MSSVLLCHPLIRSLLAFPFSLSQHTIISVCHQIHSSFSSFASSHQMFIKFHIFVACFTSLFVIFLFVFQFSTEAPPLREAEFDNNNSGSVCWWWRLCVVVKCCILASTMPLPPALAAKLAKRGIINAPKDPGKPENKTEGLCECNNM